MKRKHIGYCVTFLDKLEIHILFKPQKQGTMPFLTCLSPNKSLTTMIQSLLKEEKM